MELKQVKKQYWNHQQRAKRKGISFELSLEQWIKIWLDSGHYYNKGTKKGQYVMSRYKDQGGYAVDNVYIQTVGDNTREAFTTNNKDFTRPKLGTENNFYGKTHSPESIIKIKEARAKQVWSEESNRKRSETMKKRRAEKVGLWKSVQRV